ncbi:MAG: hypothetical protein IJG36_01070 [Synergistaceae bacterium]|nr:hypothetical protein [Synergistaceae bacterium]
MPKGKSGIKRGVGNSRSSKSGSSNNDSTIAPNREALIASSPDSMRQLESLAAKGVIPDRIVEGSREERERIYEAINRLYPEPPGEMNNYEVIQRDRRHIEVRFRQKLMEAESPPQLTLTHPDMSESARAGLIKHAIYRQRPAVELALLSRSDGYASFPIASKYGKRVLSSSEKVAADREMISYVEGLLKSPLTREGLQSNQSEWRKMNGGWRRVGSISGEEL